MRLLVVGAGATGGFYGALAARGGAEVTLVARGAHAAAMQARGIAVETPEEKFVVRPRVVSALADLAGERFDLVLLTVKEYDLAPLLPAAAALGGAVATAQNGVDAETIAAAHVAPEKLLAVVLHVAAALPHPGLVRISSPDSFLIGPAMPAAAAAARAAADALAAAGVRARYRDDILVAKWSKLVWNNAFNVVTAITGRGIGAVANDPELGALVRSMMEEVVAVARAEGVVVPTETIDGHFGRARQLGETATSTLNDVRAGRPLEHETLAGSIVRRGRARGVPTPVNDVLYPILKARSGSR